MSLINKKTMGNLARLARLELTRGEEEKLLKDFEKILEHFEELKETDTEKVSPMSGGTFEKNILRKDEDGPSLPCEEAVADFPESEKGFLKVPPVFE